MFSKLYKNHTLYNQRHSQEIVVVKYSLENTPDNNNFLAVPSTTKGVVLVKLPDKSDAACLHRHVYEWKDHPVRFSKVEEMVMVLVDISHEVHGLVSYAGFIR